MGADSNVFADAQAVEDEDWTSQPNQLGYTLRQQKRKTKI